MAKDVVGRRAGRAMRIKNGGWFWSEEIEDAFFDHLAASGNVSAAAEAVGFATPTVYRQRQRRPEFAARWQAAIEQGYVRLEIALLQAANDTLEGKEFDAERPIPKMTIEQAMNVLRAHQNLIANNGRAGPGNRAKPRPLEEVRASILRKVEAILAMEEHGDAGGGEGVVPLPLAGGVRGGDGPESDRLSGDAQASPQPLPQPSVGSAVPPAWPEGCGASSARHSQAEGEL